MTSLLPESLPGNMPDNSILGTVLGLRKELPEASVSLVSKDINLRIKAAILGIHAEDYHNDQTLDDIDLLYSGITPLCDDFWDQFESLHYLGRSAKPYPKTIENFNYARWTRNKNRMHRQ